MCENVDEVTAEIQKILELYNAEDTSLSDGLEHLKALRNFCACGAPHQETIAKHQDLQNLLHALIFDDNLTEPCPPQLTLMALQILANAIVKNPVAQRLVWRRHGDAILQQCAHPPLGRRTDVLLMIIYNIFNGEAGTFSCVSEGVKFAPKTWEKLLTEQQVLCTVVQVWQTILAEHNEASFDFLHFLFEHFLVQDGRSTVRYYAQSLKPTERVVFLDYLGRYLRHDSPNGRVHSFLLQHVSKEFKLKSDCVLRNTAVAMQQQADAVQAREAYALLQVIASASGCETYAPLYSADHSLFLNVSSLLRCLVAAGKESKPNIFTPKSKLEEVALTSDIPRDFEAEVSFELKTLLVRSIANLLYKNPSNQRYCLDTQLMPTLLECTIIDARNPLMKEWSILAIRNACIDCPEIQQIIANLTNQGAVQNDILTELNLEMGSLRIQPSKE